MCGSFNITQIQGFRISILFRCNTCIVILQDWVERLNRFIEMFEYGMLQDAGKVSAEIARIHAETEFEKYRIIQDQQFLSDYDRFVQELEGD